MNNDCHDFVLIVPEPPSVDTIVLLKAAFDELRRVLNNELRHFHERLWKPRNFETRQAAYTKPIYRLSIYICMPIQTRSLHSTASAIDLLTVGTAQANEVVDFPVLSDSFIHSLIHSFTHSLTHALGWKCAE
jgi:hypothetical protein